MSRISDIMIRQLPELHLLSVRRTIDFFSEYSGFLGNAIGEILPIIETNGAFPGSGLIVCFHNMELEALDVEAGFAVARPIESRGNVKATRLPSRTVAMTIDRGPYEKQDPTLEALTKWIPANGYESAGGIYYHYLNGEDQPQCEYLTEMSIPVVRCPE